MLAYDGFGFKIKKGSSVSWSLPSGEMMTGVAAAVNPDPDDDDIEWLQVKGWDGVLYALKVIEGECNEAGVI